MEAIADTARTLLGIGQEELSAGQMALRAAVVYVIAVAIVRLGKKRFMGRATAFDLILAILLGSIISRVITGDAPFFAGLGAALTVVAMHWLFSAISVRWSRFGTLVKGSPRLLVRDGAIDRAQMRHVHMTDGDLWEDLRGKGISDLAEVAEARLERSGKVSVIKRDRDG